MEFLSITPTSSESVTVGSVPRRKVWTLVRKIRGAAIAAILIAALVVVARPAGAQDGSGAECGGLAATIVGTDGPDVLIGTAGNDVIVGLGGNDIIRGLSGRDSLCGGEGRDRLYGGRSADRLYGGANGDLLDGEAGSDQIFGDDGNDRLIGGNGNDQLDGGRGRLDRLSGRGGNDVCTDAQKTTTWAFCESGSVEIQTCAGENATLVGSDGPDLLFGTPERDVIVALDGNDLIIAGDGDDLVCAGAGRDVVRAGRGNDLVLGGKQNDRLFGQAGSDTLLGGPGRDVLIGGFGADVLLGQAGNERLIDGGPGPDTIRGNAGVDRCRLEIYPGDWPDGSITQVDTVGLPPCELDQARRPVLSVSSAGVPQPELWIVVHDCAKAPPGFATAANADKWVVARMSVVNPTAQAVDLWLSAVALDGDLTRIGEGFKPINALGPGRSAVVDIGIQTTASASTVESCEPLTVSITEVTA